MNALKRAFFSADGWKRLVLLLSLALLLTAAGGASLSYLVTKTPSLYNLFVSGLNPTGTLVIRKTVEHPFGTDYVIPDGIEFTFAVDLGEENAGKTFDGRTADEAGVLSVTVKVNSAVTLYDLPAETTVTVTEQAAGGGFSVKDGAVSREAVIEKGVVSSVEFINTYTPEQAREVSLSVTGVKTLVGRDWQEGDRFTFQLALYKDGDWTSIGTDTVVYRLVETEDPEHAGQTILAPEPDFNRFDFSALLQGVSFDTAGTYAFRVTETEGTVGGVAYDKSESYFDVVIGDADMDGYLELQGVTTVSGNTKVTWDEATGGFAVEATFENRYAPDGSAEAVVQIKKTLTDTSGQNRGPAGFTFGLYDENGNLIQTSEATSEAGETSIRLLYGPEDTGKTFTYSVKEINGGQTIGGMTYDDSETKIQVSVVDNLDGTISAFVYDEQAAAAADNESAGGAEGENEPALGTTGNTDADSAETPETDSPEADVLEEPEELETGAPEEPEKPEEPETDMPKESETADPLFDEDATNEVTEGEPGAADISPLSDGDEAAIVNEPENGSGEEKPDSSAPEDAPTAAPVSEELPDENGTVLPEDEDVPEGERYEPDVRTAIPQNASNVYTVTFHNVYDPQDAEVSIAGDKDLSGRAMKPGEFRFNLYETGSDFQVVEDARPVTSATNSDEDGTFRFDTLTFGSVGTYYYVVTEDSSAQLGGVDYDGARYLVTVSVTDSGGTLSGETRITNETGESGEIQFRNTYTAAETLVSLTGEKIMTGRALAAGEFTFALYQADENFVYDGAAIQTVRNDENGRFSFGDLSFKEAGTWHYVVVENASSPIAGVIYDATQYRVTVTVTDDGEGALVPEIDMVASRGQEQASVKTLQFENRYSAAYATLSLGGEKVLNGGELTAGMFTFQLYEADERYTAYGSAIRSATNHADGTFIFDPFTYEEAGTHYYVIVEDASARTEGITYDDTVYGVMVTVSDAGDDQLEAEYIITETGGGVVDQICFENTYNPEPNAKPDVDNSEEGNAPSEPSNGVGTGDDSNILLYAISLAGSVALMILLLVMKKRGK